MSEATDREIDWGRAEVENGTLTVPLAGEPDSDWTESCHSVLDVHEKETHGGSWRGVRLVSPDVLVVQDVDPGSEVALRQYLEDIVHRANRDVVRRKQRNVEAQARKEAEETASSEASEKMTDRFRGFGQR